jgi:hypothetical protein
VHDPDDHTLVRYVAILVEGNFPGHSFESRGAATDRRDGLTNRLAVGASGSDHVAQQVHHVIGRRGGLVRQTRLRILTPVGHRELAILEAVYPRKIRGGDVSAFRQRARFFDSFETVASHKGNLESALPGAKQRLLGLAAVASDENKLAALSQDDPVEVSVHVRRAAQIGIGLQHGAAALGEFGGEGPPDSAAVVVVEVEDRATVEPELFPGVASECRTMGHVAGADPEGVVAGAGHIRR